MKWAAGLLTGTVLTSVVLVGSFQAPVVGTVEIVRLTPANFAKYAPQGKEVDAIAGDVVLRNKYLTAVIAQPIESRHANMTVRQVGGGLIDLATRENPSDQLSAYYPGQRQFPYRKWKALTEDGKETDLSAEGDIEITTEQGRVVVSAEGTEDRPAVEVTYTLEPDERFITVSTRFTNTGSKSVKVSLVDDLRIDSGKEHLEKSPNGVSQLFWAHDRHWNQAYGFFGLNISLEMNSDARTSVLKYRMNEGTGQAEIEPGATYPLVRWLFVGPNLLDVKGDVAELRGTTLEEIEFALSGSSGPITGAELTLRQKDVLYGSGLTDEEGKLATILPPGSYDIDVTVFGVKLATAKPLKLFLVVGGGGPVRFDIPEYKPGSVTAEITDGAGEPIPAKVAFTARSGTPQPDFGPETADFAVKNLRYTADGQFEQPLPPGEYDVIVSHGPEHDAVFTSLTVKPGETTPLKVVLQRSVDTRGWISSDFHSHSSPSGDNTGSQLGRVLNLLAEHIEFGPCTEHNRIDSYTPHLKQVDAERFMATTSGIELTGSPLPLNHQNAFPLEHKPYMQDGGGPPTDADPAAQVERLALWDNRSEKLVQINHPDLGWMFYDRDGDGKPDGGHQGMLPYINALELHPVECILHPTPEFTFRKTTIANTVFAWLQLLNQGYRYTGVVNTDAHYNFHGSSWLRNWVQSPTDTPAEIQTPDVVRATREGRLIMSNGPFLEVSARETGGNERAGPGQDLAAKSGKVELQLRVQCPNWFDVDRVFVLVNGRVSSHDYRRKTHAAKFRTEGAVRFEETLSLELPSDAHVIVAAGGEELKLGAVMGPDWKDTPPAVIANPIYVDVDGGGFKANKDTLDHPLPVKFTKK